MKSKTLIALFIALGCGVLAAVGIVNAIGDNSTAVVEATAPVLVANDFLDIHTPLTEENCHIEHWPVKLIPKDVVSDVAGVDGMFNKMRLSKGLPIMIEQIADESFFQQDMIPPGHKVVAIKVKEDDTISGLLKPGQQVDIIGIVDVPSTNGNNRDRLKIAKTFLKGIRVYSINGVRDGSAATEEKGRRGDAVVGVLVTEKQSENIVLVQRVGALKLVLRAKTDNLEPEVNPDFNQLFAGIISDPSAAQAEAQSQDFDEDMEDAPSFVMTVYNGMESERHGFDENGRLQSPEKPAGGFTYGRNHRPNASSRGGSGNRGGSDSRAAESEVSFGGPEEFDGQEEFGGEFEEDQYQGE